ncbi:MAG TPA: DUF2207 domain-containing protein [Gemmatimonadales bacterium]
MRRLLPALAFLLYAVPAAAQRSLEIERFDARIAVERDGAVDVTETITARFTGEWNGIYRTVPVKYRTPQGFNWTLDLDLLGASDGSGRALEVERERVRHYVRYKIWIPGARDTSRTVVLRYRARNGLRFFEDHDELYWNVTGDEWDVPIGAASARIELPDGATGVRAIAFNGVYGATAQDAEVTVQGGTVLMTMPQPLGFREGLTAVVGWDKGLVAEPTGGDRVAAFLAANWPLAIPIPVLLGMFLLWRRVGRDPRRLPVAVRYEPPESLTPAEAGTLMDYSADMRDITATVVDLAVRGFLRIEEREEPVLLGLIRRREYVFHRLPPPVTPRPLEPHESRVLEGIFSDGGAEVKLSDLDNEFYRHLPGIREGIFARLVDRGLYRSRPDKVKGRWTVAAIVLAALILGFGGTVGAAWLDLGPLPFVIAAILTGLIVFGFGRVMPARTVEGARTLERVLGFEEFLRRVDGERLHRVVKTPEMFERFLPFAMAFRVERKWAQAFEGIYREPPTWYVGSGNGPFDLRGFSSRLGDLSTRTERAMSSAPRSSGGSGFSGGSSGGGSGGGGGGGF